MPTNPNHLLREEINAGEHLIWSGQPRQGFRLRPSDLFLIPFSIMWGGFAIFWEAAVLIGGAPFFFTLWGIPFVLVGLYLIGGRFFVDAKQREKTAYALTHERILIVSGLFGRNVKSIGLKNLSEINLKLNNDGSGTLSFGPVQPLTAWTTGFAWPGMGGKYSPPAFEMIEQARQVYEQVLKAQRDL